MNIIPIIRCRDIEASADFYTRILGFESAWESSFPYRGLLFRSSRLDLSANSGDGEFGSCVLVMVEDVDDVFNAITARGHDFSRFTGVHRRPIDQTWGFREFYVDDPDGNTIRFASAVSVV